MYVQIVMWFHFNIQLRIWKQSYMYLYITTCANTVVILYPTAHGSLTTQLILPQ